MGRGGARVGAGRPKKAEKTKPMRVPERLAPAILSFVAAEGYQCPLYNSSVSAGFPVLADDHIDTKINLSELLIKNPAQTFLVRASGESMLDAGIRSGDILIVDKSIEPISGKIVIAAIDGHLTVKRLAKNKAGVYQLVPENKKFKPIEVLAENNVTILGVVTGVVNLNV